MSSNTNVASVSASGVVTAVGAGQTTITATVGSVFGQTTLTVVGGSTLSITTGALPAGQVGAAYSAMLAATNGNPPYKWKLTSGKLPKGIKLDKSTGAISGTPSKKSASSTFTVEVLDTKVGKPKTQNSSSATFTINISPAP